MKAIPVAARLALVVLIAVALSEVIPEVINSLLILILIGIILGHYKQFSFLTRVLGSLKE